MVQWILFQDISLVLTGNRIFWKEHQNNFVVFIKNALFFWFLLTLRRARSRILAGSLYKINHKTLYVIYPKLGEHTEFFFVKCLSTKMKTFLFRKLKNTNLKILIIALWNLSEIEKLLGDVVEVFVKWQILTSMLKSMLVHAEHWGIFLLGIFHRNSSSVNVYPLPPCRHSI